jgi:hypothetical protein
MITTIEELMDAISEIKNWDIRSCLLVDTKLLKELLMQRKDKQKAKIENNKSLNDITVV